MSPLTDKSRKQAFANYVVELMAGFAPVQAKPMFGGFGIYWQGLMFALIADERLYFKADDQSQGRFEARGLGPFTYEFKGKVGHLRYYEGPAEVYDEPEHMAQWARLGFECAVRQQKAKSPKSARKAPKARQKALDGDQTSATSAVAALKNLGPKSQEMLAKAGIKTEAQLRKLGAVRAYAKTKAVCPKASLNLLWALEGALTGKDWKAVAESERASLLMALEDAMRHMAG
jgi:DNA transformation protein